MLICTHKSHRPWSYRAALAILACTLTLLTCCPALGQIPTAPRTPGVADTSQATAAEKKDSQQPPASTVEIQPESADSEIAARLERILDATGWFGTPTVEVDQGVVFLSGVTEKDALKEWAGDLARNTRDVVAVVNRIEVSAPSLWDLSPALTNVRGLWRGFLQNFPMLIVGFAVLMASWLVSRAIIGFLLRRFNRHEQFTPLLRQVIARSSGAAFFLLGIYLVLQVLGLARLAVTVLGGTGLLGLIIGIAFRDITENFLASIFLSIQRPFRSGDLIEVNGITGLVQRLTVRTTILMSLDGNHIQVPNSTVYKSTIRNFTSNPNRREEFIVGVGYDDRVGDAQDVALNVLCNHPAVLTDPEPWVLVNDLGPSTVNLKVYFWLDGTKHSWLKVRSSVIRLVKRAFQEHGISMPDEAREVIIKGEVPFMVEHKDGQPGQAAIKAVKLDVQTDEDRSPGETAPATRTTPSPGDTGEESDAIATAAEAGLDSDTGSIERQARNSRTPEAGQDLLD